MSHSDSHRTAVVVSGGTAKGAYAAGYLTEIFRDPKLASSVDLLSGTSTGALIAPMLALHFLRVRRRQGEEDLLECIRTNYCVPSTRVFRDEPRKWWARGISWIVKRWTKKAVNGRMVGMLLETGATLDTAPLRCLVDEQFTDARLEELIAGAGEVECLVNCVSAQSGNLRAFSTRDAGMTASMFRDAIYASCLQPVFMPLCEVGVTQPRDEYMDGGVRDVVPVYEAWAREASRVLAVALTPDSAQIQTPARYNGKGVLGALALLLRVLKDFLMGEVGDDDLIEARQAAALGRLVLLARARGATPDQIEDALSPLNREERVLTNRQHPLAALHIHRPAPGTPLEEEFRWDSDGMRASIEAGKRAAEADRAKVEDLLLPPPNSLVLAYSHPVPTRSGVAAKPKSSAESSAAS